MEAFTITPNLELPPAQLERLYADMVRIRRFEERVVELFQAGLVKGTAHSYAGEEAIAVGACAHLRQDDYVASYHRGHGHCIAKGARTDRMMAELMGRATGYCSGLGGSMHVADMERNILGANGIVGAAMPLSVGAGLAIKLRGGDQVVIAFFGDGANNQGIFHESLNLAAVWRLPVLFVCENNQYALSTSYRKTTAVDSVATRAAAYDIPGVRIDGNDVLAVHAAVGEAVSRARRGQGPSLIEAMTWRWGQHSMRANLRDPRSDDDMAAWIARDPIPAFAGVLTGREIFTGAELEALESAARAEIDGAVAFAEAQPRTRACGAPSGGLRAARRPSRGACRGGNAGDARADLRPGAQRGHGPGDGARCLGLPDGRGRRRDRWHLSGLQGSARALRARAGARHADLGGDLLRRWRRRGDRGHAADRRGPDLRLRDPDDGHAGQPGGQVPLHAGWPADRAAGGPGAAGRRHSPGRPAQPEPRGLVRPCPGPGRGRRLLGLRCQGPADRRDPGRQPGDFPRAQAVLPGPGGAGARGALRDPAGQGRDPPAGHRRHDRRDPDDGRARRCRRQPASRRTASTPR